MKFPLEFKECPMCHSKERVFEQLVNEEKVKGTIAMDRIATCEMEIVPVIDPIAGNYISAPVATVYYDICGECGFKYPTHVTTQVLPRHQIEKLLGLPVIKIAQ